MRVFIVKGRLEWVNGDNSKSNNIQDDEIKQDLTSDGLDHLANHNRSDRRNVDDRFPCTKGRGASNEY